MCFRNLISLLIIDNSPYKFSIMNQHIGKQFLKKH
jgi:hypothetical protein